MYSKALVGQKPEEVDDISTPNTQLAHPYRDTMYQLMNQCSQTELYP